MLVHDPHDLGGVDGGAAAHSDDDVRLELMHLGQALHGVLNLGVNANVKELGSLDAHIPQLVDDGVAGAQLIQRGVGDDEGPLEVVDLLHLPQGHGGAAGLVIDLLGQLEPEHILLADGDVLDVQQLLIVGVAHEGGVAHGAGPQSQGGSQAEVVQVADAAEGCGLVDEDAASLHPQAELGDLLLLGGVDVQCCGVACAALQHQLVADVESLVQRLGLVHTQQSGQLLVGPRAVMRGVVGLIDQNLGVIGNLDPGHFSEVAGGLANSGGLDAVGLGVEEHIGHLGGLIIVEEVTPGFLQQALDLVIHAGQDGDMLLGGADHTVIEGLGMDDGLYGHPQVGGLVNDHVAVAGAYADGGGARGVSGLYHAGAAGGHDQVHALHQHVGDLHGGNGDPADDMLGQARLDGGVPHDLRGGDGAVHRMGMRREDDGVAGLQRQHDFINGSGGRVGSGGNGGDDTLRGCNLFHAIGLVFGNDTAGLLIAHVVPDMLRGILILGDLIHNDAVAGLLTGHLGQGDPHFGHGHSRLFTDGIHLLLGKGTVRFLGCTNDRKGFLQGLNRVDGQRGRHIRSSFIFDHWMNCSPLVSCCMCVQDRNRSYVNGSASRALPPL